MSAKILSTGHYLPEKVVTNDDLAQMMDTSDEWISKRTGIRSRHVSTGENTSEICAKAAQKALDKADLSSQDMGFVIVATMSPDSDSPSTAANVQAIIGAENAFAFDISAACSGFAYAFSVAEKLMASGKYEYGMVIGGECMSKILDWTDRTTAVLFGDGAGAVILEKSEESCLLAESLHTRGKDGNAIVAGQKAVDTPFSKAPATPAKEKMVMEGRAVYDFVVREMPQHIEDTITQGGLTLEDIKFFIMHQANQRMIEVVARKLKMPKEKFPLNIEHVANTSAGSIPILLDQLLEAGELELGSKEFVTFSGYGGGLTWATLLIRL